LALNIEVSEEVVEKAVVLALANETKFDLSEVLKTQGAGAKAGKAAELVKLFTEADELEAVSQGQTWAESNASYISGFGEYKCHLCATWLTTRYSPLHPRIHCAKVATHRTDHPMQQEHGEADLIFRGR
jgi:hypothetical protein